jgi:hypothetical protein
MNSFYLFWRLFKLWLQLHISASGSALVWHLLYSHWLNVLLQLKQRVRIENWNNINCSAVCRIMEKVELVVNVQIDSIRNVNDFCIKSTIFLESHFQLHFFFLPAHIFFIICFFSTIYIDFILVHNR